MSRSADAPARDAALAAHDRMVEALRSGLTAPGDARPQRIDTHISTVILTATLAYKLKKPVRLPFLDFTEAAVRQALCETEVRLNRRLAPALYLGVAPVVGGPDAPRFAAPRPVADSPDPTVSAGGRPGPELAVVMRAFEQRALWAHRVPAGAVSADEARALGAAIGRFHRDRAPRRPGSVHGTAAAFQTRVRENFDTLRAAGTGCDHRLLATLERDAQARFGPLAALRDARNLDGFVRECHGDLHLGNLVTIDGVAVPFDCLEFDEALRTVDVASDVAFVMMDLAHAQRPDLAHALLDGWLAVTGDFDAVALLDDERAYRATVRAKVAALRAAQAPDAPASQASRDDCAGYLARAASFAQRPQPLLVVTHGLSGSGKSVLSAVLAAELGAVRLRSDVERKRDRGLAAHDRSGAHGAMYAPAARDAVYARLAERAAPLLAAGWPVVVDAAFLSRGQRRRFSALAATLGVRFAIADLQAPEAVLRERLAARAARGTDPSDADLAVLDAQLRTREPLDDGERALAFVWLATDPPDRSRVVGAWHAWLAARPPGPSRPGGAPE